VCSILSQLAREDRVAVVEALSIDAPKTKLLSDKIKAMGLGANGASVLVITDSVDENLFLASRNLPHVMVVEPRHADPVSLVHFSKVLITRAALAKVQEMLA
jgi:large subunit ribosomal protein L4